MIRQGLLLLLGSLLLLASTTTVLASRLPGTPYPVPSQGLNCSHNQAMVIYDRATILANGGPEDTLALAALAGWYARDCPLMLEEYEHQSAVVLYTNVSNLNEVNLAISMVASHDAALLLSARQWKLYGEQLNATVVANATGLDPVTIWEAQPKAWSSRIFVVADSPYLADYAVFARAFFMYADPVADPTGSMTHLFYRITRTLQPQSAILGWMPGGVPRELLFVTAAAQNASWVHCADGAVNQASLTGFDLPQYKQWPGQNQTALRPKVAPASTLHPSDGAAIHTVTLLWTDGDNTGGYDQQTLIDDNHFNAPGRGHAPMGWTVSPALAELYPALLLELYRNATPNDEFVAGPSGLGYTYPDELRDSATFINLTSAVMNKTDMHTLNLISGNPIETVVRFQEIAEPYARDPQVDGVYYYNYFSYDELIGATAVASDGTPIVGARMWTCNHATLEDCLFSCGPGCLPITAIPDFVDKLQRNASSVHGYSLIALDAWSNTVSAVNTLVDSLHALDGVEVVLPSEFNRRLRAVLANGHA
ncbi:uncharacterized protein MONBRDRAFT_6171 [Monosiga brevicollis MX1]|uniref:GxGYxYP putative glycoside hydrolase C-terminal domain-containing protein n=1 Tax=Monosiga brevicollis TaxID=81824 RepID=A9UT15_MONBE|nr:uncharacterized protein MONBRDRAFT_6171 [Monosiga brevicollis MX1]EDQ91163.1 predicted protein [Monosiga brevicollis MX1]|eukprot:XP_001743585.1 hypothetical protein [Monosiga brevicollis MX1]